MFILDRTSDGLRVFEHHRLAATICGFFPVLSLRTAQFCLKDHHARSLSGEGIAHLDRLRQRPGIRRQDDARGGRRRVRRGDDAAGEDLPRTGAQTPGDQVHPVVLFRVSVNTWIEPPVRYLVDPKEAGRIR